VLVPNALTYNTEGVVPNAGISSVEGGVLIVAAQGLRALITYRGCGTDPREWKQRIVDTGYAMSIFTY
jgi:hypothetical protein